MIFNSFEFIYFFPIVVVGYFLIPHKYRWLWLLLGSYYFYMAHEPELVILLLISTSVDYFCGLRMSSPNVRHKKWILALSIVVNIGILITFKYLGFFTASLEQLLNFFGITLADREQYGSYTVDRIILPVGISFYTFQTLSYTIDVYRGKISPERHFGKFALYVAFFPQLVAGPIERAHRLLPQLKAKLKPHIPDIKKGLIYMAWGFFLKVVVADRLGMYVDIAYSDPELYHGLPLWISALFFGFQLYFDFAGYTAIAIGAAKVFGINLMQNFNRPLYVNSFSQFWARWHISFMNWLRDYLYAPLVKNAHLKGAIALLIVFFVVGLWHGANWTFVLWGVINGFFLFFERVTMRLRKRLFSALRIPKTIVDLGGNFVVMGSLALSLVLFRSPSLSEAWSYYGNMVHITSLRVNIMQNYVELFISFVLILLVQAIHFRYGNDNIHQLVTGRAMMFRWTLYIAFAILFVLLAVNRQNAFIYFQF